MRLLYLACTRARSQLYIVAYPTFSDQLSKKLGVPMANLIVQKYEWCETNQEFKLNNDRSYSEEEIERGEWKVDFLIPYEQRKILPI